MMKIIHGDILSPVRDGKPTIVCHQVNCRGVMGAGLALQIKKKFPSVFDSYRDKCSRSEYPRSMLGDVQYCSVLGDAGYIIANIFAQDKYGAGECCTDYVAVRRALWSISVAFPHDTIRIPYRMGCGLTGGDWDKVQDIIKQMLDDAGVNVEIWVYE